MNPDADSPKDEPDDESAVGSPASEDPAAIIARIQMAGDAVPATLHDAVYGEKDPPSLVVESAEGVTTFGGFNGHPGTRKAKQWLEARLAAITKRYSAGSDAASKSEPAKPTGPDSTSTS